MFRAACRMVEVSPVLGPEAYITNGKIEFTATGKTIQALASDYAGAAGANHIIAVFDELWGYVRERAIPEGYGSTLDSQRCG